MSGVTEEQRDAILTKAEALAGEPLGEAGALLAEIACARWRIAIGRTFRRRWSRRSRRCWSDWSHVSPT